MGGHEHLYEREYPYLGNHRYLVGKESPYLLDKSSRYLVTCVEGTAGNDRNLEFEVDKLEDYTANIKYGESGYGLVKVTQTDIFYQHFSSENNEVPTDSFLIDFSGLFAE